MIWQLVLDEFTTDSYRPKPVVTQNNEIPLSAPSVSPVVYDQSLVCFSASLEARSVSSYYAQMTPFLIDPNSVRRYDREGGKHTHDHAQVLFGIDGTLHVEVEGHGAWVDSTSGLVVPPGACHTYCADRMARVLVLDDLTGPVTDRFRRFALPQGWQRCELGTKTLVETLLTSSTIRARRRLNLEALRECVDADLVRPWSVADLAAVCCLSPQRLRARFAQALGQSPMAFVRGRRLNRAEELLRRGLPLETVALHVGYSTASALSAALRRDRDTGAQSLRKRRAFLES